MAFARKSLFFAAVFAVLAVVTRGIVDVDRCTTIAVGKKAGTEGILMLKRLVEIFFIRNVVF